MRLALRRSAFAKATADRSAFGLRRSIVHTVGCATMACVFAAAGLAHAQTDGSDTVRSSMSGVARGAPRIEFAVLGGVFSGADLGETRADMLTNDVPAGGRSALFTTSARIRTAPIVEARLSVRLSRAWFVEGGASHARPEFAVDISGDVEGAADVTAASRLTQVTVDAALQRRWPGRRVTPFVAAGGGYLRQLDEFRTTAQTGAVIYGGGGVRVAVAPGSRGFARRVALRADARVVWLRDGVVLRDQRAPSVHVSAGLSIGL